MDQRSRVRRVADKRKELETWAKDEGVSVTELLGNTVQILYCIVNSPFCIISL